MKLTTPVLLGLCLALSAHAQENVLAPSGAAPAVATTPTAPLAPATLDTLLGPIALYPDALIALILPASTTPTDIVLSARYVTAKNDLAQLDDQPWSDSVKALVHYPDVLKWMDENLPWTQAVGQAFLDQPADVMNSVQRLRARARATGALVDTPQQRVVTEGPNIVIVPAQPEVIYVPVYDPAVVYVQRTVWVDRPFITFSFGYVVGSWFVYDCDWGRRDIRVISRPPHCQSRPQSWNYAYPQPQRPAGQPWQPPANYHSHPVSPSYTRPPTPRPFHPVTQTITTLVVSPSTKPVPTVPSRPPFGSPGMMPSTPNRPSRAQMIDRPNPVTPTVVTPSPASPQGLAPSKPATLPSTTPQLIQPKPSVVSRPTRPADGQHPDRSNRPVIIPQPSRATVITPVTPPTTTPVTPDDSTTSSTDPRKQKKNQ